MPRSEPPEEEETIGTLTREERREKIQKYQEKKKSRKQNGHVRYECRKSLAQKRYRYQGRFVKVSDLPMLMQEHVYDPNSKEVPKPIFKTVRDTSVREQLMKEEEDREDFEEREGLDLLQEQSARTHLLGINADRLGNACGIDDVEMCDPDFPQ